MSDLPFIVGMRTARSIKDIEAWLESHCKGQWDVRLQDMAESLKQKEIIISFEKAAERDAFKAAFAKSAPGQARKPGEAA